MDDKLQKLLTEINKIYIVAEKERQEKQSRGEYYNVFNVLGLWSEEVRLHSAFIAELLNPNGKHGLGGAFLKAFLKQANLSENFIDFGKVNDNNIVERSIGIKTETDGGRIDIIIEDGSHALIIENKIYAGDQENQLLRYFNYAKQKFINGFEIIYLTLDGHEASSASTRNNKEVIDKYICMSYREGIIAWIEECARIAFAHPLVRETINQYIQLIKQLTNITMESKYIDKVAEIAINNIDSTVALMEAQHRIAEILREEHIFKPLKIYAQNNNINFTCDITDDAKAQSVPIEFSKPNWKGCISIIAEKQSWADVYIGISCEHAENIQVNKLECLKRSNKWYPYGWEWVNITDWESPGSFKAIMDGKVANWIKEKVNAIIAELEKRKIEL